MPFGGEKKWTKARVEGLKKPPRQPDPVVETVPEQSELERAMRGIADLEHVEPTGRDYSGVVEDPLTPASADKLLEQLARRGDDTATRAEETPLETRTRLESLVQKREKKPKSKREKKVLELKEEQIEKTTQERRDIRSQKFAEKYGVSEVRDALLEAELAYEKALTQRSTLLDTIRRGMRDTEFYQAKEHYAEAQLAWRRALTGATEHAEAQDKIQARFIGLRDTTLRPLEAETRAREAQLSESGKTAFSKMKSWGTSALGSYLSGTKHLAEKALSLRERILPQQDTYDREKALERYTRAVRIVGGATIGTAAAGLLGVAGIGAGVGSMGVGLTWLLRIGRGTLGIAVGSSAGYGAGSVFKKTLGEKRRMSLQQTLRDKDALTGEVSAKQLQEERVRWEKGNALARAKAQQKWEMGAAIAAGGATSFGSGYGISLAQHQGVFGHLRAVTEAAHTMHAEGPALGADHGMQQGGVTEKVSVEKPSTSPIELTVAKGEGANQLFQDLKAQYGDASHYPEHIKAILSHKPAEVVKVLGFGRENGGILLHPQDTLSVDTQGRLIFHDHIHDKSFVVIEEKGISDEWSAKIHKLSVSSAQQESSLRPVHQPTAHTVANTEHVEGGAKAVAQANKDELLREQKAYPSTTVGTPESGTLVTPAPESTIPKPVLVPQEVPATPATAPEQSVTATRPSVVETTSTQSGDTHTPESAPAPASMDKPPAETLVSTHLAPESIDRAFPRPYLTDTGKISIFGGTPEQQREFAIAYAQLHPGETVRYTVPRHGFLGTIKQHVEQITAGKDGTVRIEKVTAAGKRFEAIDPRTFTEVIER